MVVNDERTTTIPGEHFRNQLSGNGKVTTVMIENGPYIIVDNRRIAPIAPSSPTHPAGRDQKDPRDQPFGIVDRVTISDAGRERFRQHNAGSGPPMTTSANRHIPGKHPRHAPLLTYAPRQR